jgi:hypothetical protein
MQFHCRSKQVLAFSIFRNILLFTAAKLPLMVSRAEPAFNGDSNRLTDS